MVIQMTIMKCTDFQRKRFRYYKRGDKKFASASRICCGRVKQNHEL